MREDKLNQIIGVLKDVPPSSFEMNYWWRRSGCGTVGCAIGWAIEKLGPDFGLYEISEKWDAGFDEGQIVRRVENRFGDQNYEAISEVLDISPNEAVWLFSPFGYSDVLTVTPEMVIDRIEKFIEGERPKRDYTYVV